MEKIKKLVNELIENGTKYIFIMFVIINIIMICNRYIFKVEIMENLYNEYLEYILNNIFTEDSKDFLANILFTVSGFIITIISVFGIGYSKATIKICEYDLEEKFCRIGQHIAYTSIILLTIVILMYNIRKVEIFTILLFLLMVYLVIKFIIFTMIVFKMFNYNIKNSKKEFEEDNKRNNEIITLLRKIANVNSENVGNYEKSKEYSEKIRNKV